jgi:integrase
VDRARSLDQSRGSSQRFLPDRGQQESCLSPPGYSEGHWLFPSPVTGRPYHADSIRNDYLVPTSLKLGLGRIGFHTLRHTYRAWLDETGAPVGVQQKLMRHAHVSTTMDQYGNASAQAKRKANRPIVQRLLRRSATQQISIQ